MADPRFDADRRHVALRAVAAGVQTVVVVAADPQAWTAAGGLAEPRAGPATPEADQPPLHRLFACGLHPHEAAAASPTVWADLQVHLGGPNVVALGEIGLDYHYDHSPRDVQRRAFEVQLTLAADLGLPIILHERESSSDMLELLRGVGLPPQGGVWHCFAGGPALAAEAVELGLHLGFGGLMTFRRGTEEVRAAARVCPADRLLLETDAPYLAPVPHRGGRNEPAYVAAVAEYLAQLRGVPVEELARQTSHNAERLFRPHPEVPPGMGWRG